MLNEALLIKHLFKFFNKRGILGQSYMELILWCVTSTGN